MLNAKQASMAELSVIGSMLINESTVPALMQELRPEDFSASDTRHIFEAIQSLFLSRRPVDPVTVQGALGSDGYRDLLASAIRETPSAANCMEYARQLKDRRLLREIQTSCMEIVAETTDLATAKELLAHAAGLLVEKQSTKDQSYLDLLTDLMRRQEDNTPPDYLDWGIEALNRKLTIGPGRFVILGADSSVGKTALALQFALKIARQKRVGFFSYETTLPDATDRLAANDADISLGRIKGKHLSRDDIQRLITAGSRSDKVDLRIMETARYTVEDIRAKVITRGFEVIFVDYLQLIPTRKRDRYEAVTEVSIGLHALAQELGVTVVALSQVTVPETNRSGQRRYICTDDLRESRQLKMDADAIMLLDLSDPTDRDSNRVLQIGKNRDGPLAHLVLHFEPSRMRFSYVEPEADDPAAKERLAKMDAKREAARQKKQEAEEARAAQSSMFQNLEAPGKDLPF